MKKVVIAILSIIVLTVSSCEIEGSEPCVEEKASAAIITAFPDSIKVGNTHKLEITYILESDCGNFERFDVSTADNSFNVELITKYEGCNCNLEFTEAEISFDINLDYPGIYEYNFWQADGDYDTRSVTIFE